MELKAFPVRILVSEVNPLRAGGIFATEGPFLEELQRRPGVHVATFPFGGLSTYESRIRKSFRLLLDLVRFALAVRRERPDIVHLNSAFDSRALLRDTGYAFLAPLLGTRLFVKYHGSSKILAERSSGLKRKLIDYVFRQASFVGVLSSEERGNFIRGGHPAEKIVVVKNAVNVDRFSGPRSQTSGPCRVLFMARFIPSKGLLDVIRAMRIIVDRGVPVQLLCVGDGKEREAATTMVHALGLNDVVSFVGYVPEPQTTEYYLSADILVMPTRSEGFSMTIFQAVASGMPVVTTKIRAAADYLREPDNCLWIEPGDEHNLAERLIELLVQPALRSRMGTNNRRLATSFAPPRIVDEYLSVYRHGSCHD